VAVAAQRRLKGQVVAEQLRRLAGVDVAVEVEAVPGDVDGLRWRTRMRYHPTPSGGTGLRRHRSRDVLEIDDCLIQAPGARVQVEGEVPDTEPGGETVVETVQGRRFEVAADGFWQVHLGAATTLVDAVLEAARPAPGERVLDLFSGVGLFSVFLAEAVGERGQLLAVEGDRRAAALAGSNLSAYPWAEVVHGPVDRVLETLTDPPAAAGSAPGSTSPAIPRRWPGTWRRSRRPATASRRCGRSTCSR
jgi:tRNA/tmRNA/rRNA uracil-C5-methylase (TrmA/RlmC/RlmD family)